MELRNYFDGLENHGYYFTTNFSGQLFYLTGAVATVWGEARDVDEFLNNLKVNDNWGCYGYKLKYVICAQEFFGAKGLFFTAYFINQEN